MLVEISTERLSDREQLEREGRAGKRMGRRTTVAGQRLAGATVGTGQTKLETKAVYSGRTNLIWFVCVWGNPRMFGTMVL